MLERWQRKQFVVAGIALQGIAFSVGVADTAEGLPTPAALLKRVDERLLLAKRSVRAQVQGGGAAVTGQP